MSKKHIALIVVMVLLSIILVIGGTYAFFIANVSGNENAENITIASGDFELTFTDSQGIYFDEDIRPGTSADKTFTVQNTSTADDTYTYNYNIKLTELDVTYEKQDLVYTLQEYTDDNYNVLKPDGVDETGYINKNTVNEDGEMYLAIGIERPPKGTYHYYKLTIEFKSLEGVNQNYNQGKTFGGKINVDDNRDVALYEPPTPFSEIIKVDNINIFDDDPDNNLRYAGPNEEVNNYIWFNCDDYKNLTQELAQTTCEKWRIIGLFNNVTETNGSIENLVKIIRYDSAGDIAWDSNNANNWGNASLQKSLNNDYYNGTQLSDNYGNSAKGINDSTRSMIEQITWNLGGHNTNDVTAQTFYSAERGAAHYGSNPTTYDGYIGLMYPSDYGYATTGSTKGKDRAACLSTTLYNYDSASYCYEKDWLYISDTNQWTLTPDSVSSSSVFNANIHGLMGSNWGAWNVRGVRPTLYLKSDVGIVDGEGTSDIPYIIKNA